MGYKCRTASTVFLTRSRKWCTTPNRCPSLSVCKMCPASEGEICVCGTHQGQGAAVGRYSAARSDALDTPQKQVITAQPIQVGGRTGDIGHATFTTFRHRRFAWSCKRLDVLVQSHSGRQWISCIDVPATSSGRSIIEGVGIVVEINAPLKTS
jgi:hypothetical protein